MKWFKTDPTTTEVQKMPDKNTPTTPQRERKPKDLLFLILFLSTMMGLAYLSQYSTGKGDPYRYINGSDSWGNVCGRKRNQIIRGADQSGMDQTSRPYEFHMGLNDINTLLNPLSYVLSKKKPAVLCVSECPKEIMSCRDLLILNGYNLTDTVIDEHVCTMAFGLILPHTDLLGRCIPSQLVRIGLSVANVVGREGDGGSGASNPSDDTSSFDHLESQAASIAKNIIASMLKYWKDIMYLSAMSFVVCFLVVILLQFLTRFAVIACLIWGGLGSVLFTSYLWYSYALEKGYVTEEDLSRLLGVVVPASEAVAQFIEDSISGGDNVTAASLSNNSAMGNISIVKVNDIIETLAFDSIKKSDYLLPWAIIATIFTTILLLILISLRKSFCLVINIFDEACLAVFKMPSLLFEPIKGMFAYVAIGVFFLLTSSYILTIQTAVVDDRGFVVFIRRTDISVPGLFAGHLLGCLWLIQFVSGCQQMVIAGTISQWFFSKGEEEQEKEEEKSGVEVGCRMSPTARSTADLFLYNLGTVAFGSLIIAIVQFLRIALNYLQNQLRGNESKSAQNLLRALRCCLLCFEKILKYINRNAYICSAMYGYNFFQSGKRALTLLINNAQHAMALGCVGSVCNFFGKIAVVSFTGFLSIAYFLFYRLGRDAELSEYWVPLLTVAVASYIIAHCFFTVYQMAIDTIFLCFCDDQERNNGEDRPYYSSMRLQKFMSGKHTGKKERASSKRETPSVKSEAEVPHESARSSHFNASKMPNLIKSSQRQVSPRPRAASGIRRKLQTNIVDSKFFIENEFVNNDSMRSINKKNPPEKGIQENKFLNDYFLSGSGSLRSVSMFQEEEGSGDLVKKNLSRNHRPPTSGKILTLPPRPDRLRKSGRSNEKPIWDGNESPNRMWAKTIHPFATGSPISHPKWQETIFRCVELSTPPSPYVGASTPSPFKGAYPIKKVTFACDVPTIECEMSDGSMDVPKSCVVKMDDAAKEDPVAAKKPKKCGSKFLSTLKKMCLKVSGKKNSKKNQTGSPSLLPL